MRRARSFSSGTVCDAIGIISATMPSAAAAMGRSRFADTPGARPLRISASTRGRSENAPTSMPRNETINSSTITRSASGKNACSLRESAAPTPVKMSENSTTSAREYAASASSCPFKRRVSAALTAFICPRRLKTSAQMTTSSSGYASARRRGRQERSANASATSAQQPTLSESGAVSPSDRESG